MPRTSGSPGSAKFRKSHGETHQCLGGFASRHWGTCFQDTLTIPPVRKQPLVAFLPTIHRSREALGRKPPKKVSKKSSWLPPRDQSLKKSREGRKKVPKKGDSKWEKPVSAKICGFLRFPAKICGFSAVFCANLRLPNPLIYRASRKSAKICKNQRKCAFRVRFLPFAVSLLARPENLLADLSTFRDFFETF